MDIWKMIEDDILTSDVDIYIVLASICDITDRFHTRKGRRYFLPPFDMNDRFKKIESTMSIMANNFQLIGKDKKLTGTGS